MAKYTLKELSVSKLEYGSGAAACEFDGNVRYVRITDITDEGKLADDIVSPSYFEEKHILHDGDILFARTGATVGKTFLYRETYGKCVYAGFLIRMIPDTNKVLPDYIYYFTKSPRYHNFIAMSMKVVAQPNINAKQYGDLEIDIPSFSEQESVVRRLTKLDVLIALRKEQLAKLDELVKARFVEMFGHCEKYRRLEEYSMLITKGASPKWQGIEYCEEGTLFVTSENVRDGYLDLSKRKYLDNRINEIQPRSVLKRNDVLINIVGASIGRAAIYNYDKTANINQAVALVRVDFSQINRAYLLTYLNSSQAIEMYTKMKKGGARDNLSLQNISDLLIPVSSLNAQNQFASFVEQTNKSKLTIQSSLDKLEVMKKALMQEYFG